MGNSGFSAILTAKRPTFEKEFRVKQLMTVGIPVYNAMPYLPETMESILGQTFRDFEILVINDGSTDDSLQYLNTLSDRRLRIIGQRNQGLTTTLNRMLKEARTPWLVRQDADDIAFPERLSRIATGIQRHPDAGMFYSRAAHFQRGQMLGELRTTKGSPEELRELTKAGYLLSICHPTITLNVDAARAVGGYRFDLHVEDYDLYWRMAWNFDIRFIEETLLGYRMNTGSISDRNMVRQAVNVLFVQYLLMSQITGYDPLPYEEIAPELELLVDQPELAFRRTMRSAMGNISERRYLSAFAQIGKSFVRSPLWFTNRILRHSKGVNRLGAAPERFFAEQERFWTPIQTEVFADAIR
jgi:glycosyltransferase involved in cell wall biosynthesis